MSRRERRKEGKDEMEWWMVGALEKTFPARQANE